MTALTNKRALSTESWTYHKFTLSSGEVAYQGGIAAIDTASGEVVVGATSTTLIPIGTFAENKDASGAAALVNVRLSKPIEVTWFANDGGDPIDAADIGGTAYIVDDQTVAATDGTSTRSALGRIWAVESARGVAVQILI